MKVSVIIPSYNHSEYVLHSIQSVLLQDWHDIDLIVIDDGSTDGSVKKIRNFQAHNKRFRFNFHENRGVISTLNEGLRLAQGDLFCLCSSDDRLPPGSIRKRAEFLQRSPEHVAVFGDRNRFNISGPIPGGQVDDKRRDIFRSVDPIPLFLQGLNLPIHTMMSRTGTLRGIGGFDSRFRVCEDLDVQLLHFLEGPVGFLDDLVYEYRWHATNTSKDIKRKARADMVLLYDKYCKDVPKLKDYNAQIEKGLVRQYFRLGRCLTEMGGDIFERKLLRGAWKHLPREPRLLFHLLINEFKMLGLK